MGDIQILLTRYAAFLAADEIGVSGEIVRRVERELDLEESRLEV